MWKKQLRETVTPSGVPVGSRRSRHSERAGTSRIGALDLSSALDYVYRSAPQVRSYRSWSAPWVSQPIVPGTSAASRLTGFVRAWRLAGDAKRSAVVARRDGNVSPSNCPRNTQAPRDGFGFPRALRLTRRRDILTVIREGRRIRTKYLDVRVLASPLGHSRIGVIVPKHQHTAVERNRLKRRLRELVRIELVPALRAHAATDLAIRARAEAYRASFSALRDDIGVVSGRIHGGNSVRS